MYVLSSMADPGLYIILFRITFLLRRKKYDPWQMPPLSKLFRLKKMIFGIWELWPTGMVGILLTERLVSARWDVRQCIHVV